MRLKPASYFKKFEPLQTEAAGRPHTHILSKFTSQFASKDSKEQAVPVSTEEEWSASSLFDSSNEDSESDCACESAQGDVSRSSDSAIRSINPEDHALGFTTTPAAASSKGTEYFELSPP